MLQIKEQIAAQKAYQCVKARKDDNKSFDDYVTFAESFPTLIHTCGLVQALAFAQAKKHDDYVADLQTVYSAIDVACNLPEASRNADLKPYMRMTRHATMAATWIKRYCQALDKKAEEG